MSQNFLASIDARGVCENLPKIEFYFLSFSPIWANEFPKTSPKKEAKNVKRNSREYKYRTVQRLWTVKNRKLEASFVPFAAKIFQFEIEKRIPYGWMVINEWQKPKTQSVSHLKSIIRAVAVRVLCTSFGKNRFSQSTRSFTICITTPTTLPQHFINKLKGCNEVKFVCELRECSMKPWGPIPDASEVFLQKNPEDQRNWLKWSLDSFYYSIFSWKAF